MMACSSARCCVVYVLTLLTLFGIAVSRVVRAAAASFSLSLTSRSLLGFALQSYGLALGGNFVPPKDSGGALQHSWCVVTDITFFLPSLRLTLCWVALSGSSLILGRALGGKFVPPKDSGRWHLQQLHLFALRLSSRSMPFGASLNGAARSSEELLEGILYFQRTVVGGSCSSASLCVVAVLTVFAWHCHCLQARAPCMCSSAFAL